MRRTAFIAAMLLVAASTLDAQSTTGQATGKRVTANGVSMYYEVSGAGEPLIVLHGAYMAIPSMGEIVPMLAKTHRVYALEFQGHGRTADIDRPITYQHLADDVAAFMDAVGVAKAGVGRVRRARLPAGVHRLHPADDAGHAGRVAAREGLPEARAEPERFSRARPQADRPPRRRTPP